MLKNPASSVLASFRGSGDSHQPERWQSPVTGLHSLRPCLGQGASQRARVGRVKSLVFLSILRERFPYSFSATFYYWNIVR